LGFRPKREKFLNSEAIARPYRPLFPASIGSQVFSFRSRSG
jgi:hypothetical protein